MASGRARLPFTPANVRHIELAYPKHATTNNYQQLKPTQDHNFNVLNSFTEKERQIVFDALNRDESVRQREAARLM